MLALLGRSAMVGDVVQTEQVRLQVTRIHGRGVDEVVATTRRALQHRAKGDA